jgi:hypothetical protein
LIETTDPRRSRNRGWWLCTEGFFATGGKKFLGPFVSRDLALTVRGYVEKAERRSDLFVDEIK